MATPVHDFLVSVGCKAVSLTGLQLQLWALRFAGTLCERASSKFEPQGRLANARTLNLTSGLPASSLFLRFFEDLTSDAFCPTSFRPTILSGSHGHGSISQPPVNINQSPLKSVLKWVVHLPPNGTIGLDPQPRVLNPSLHEFRIMGAGQVVAFASRNLREAFFEGRAALQSNTLSTDLASYAVKDLCHRKQPLDAKGLCFMAKALVVFDIDFRAIPPSNRTSLSPTFQSAAPEEDQGAFQVALQGSCLSFGKWLSLARSCGRSLGGVWVWDMQRRVAVGILTSDWGDTPSRGNSDLLYIAMWQMQNV